MKKRGVLMLGELLEQKAKKNKDRVFLYYKDDELSYREINDISNRVANGFLKLGVNKKENVCIFLPNCPEFLYTWFGLAKIGAVETPVNETYRGEFLRYNIDNCDAKVIVLHTDFKERLKLIQQDLPKLEKVVIVGGEGGKQGLKFNCISFKELLNCAAERPRVEVDQYDPITIMYTSGTTGNPKGVIISAGAAMNLAIEQVRLRDITSQDVLYCPLPLYHGAAQGMNVVPCLVADASLVLAEKFSASNFWNEVKKYRATHFQTVGAMLHYIYKLPPREDDADNTLKVIYASPTPKDFYWDFKRRFNVRFVEGYALTESFEITWNAYSGPSPKLGSCGKASAGYEVKIVDENDNEVPPGVVGEIVSRPTRPNFMMSGYYKMPDKTLEAFRNLWFHTGDYGLMDEDGYFYFIDRKKDYLRVGGQNISSMQVEETIYSHPKIAEAVAVGIRAEGTEDELALFIILKPGEELAPQELMAWAEEQLPRFAMPRYIELVDQFPRTPSERVQKYKLREKGVGPGAWDRVKAGYKLKY